MLHHRIRRIFSFALVLILLLSLCSTALAKYSTLKLGEKSDAVLTMQNALKKKGFYKGTVDGNFGPATRRAVVKYQTSLGIKADGKAGDKTLTALYEGGSKAINEVNNRKASSLTTLSPTSLYYGNTGSRVKALQKALKAAGYFKGTIDGVYGDLTELAVRKFQTAKGMHVDGIAGTKTLSRLNNAQKAVKLKTSLFLSVGSRGSTVKSLQVKLDRMGYSAPAGTEDIKGVYGTATASVVKSWQAATGRSATGSITQSEYNAIILGN